MENKLNIIKLKNYCDLNSLTFDWLIPHDNIIDDKDDKYSRGKIICRMHKVWICDCCKDIFKICPICDKNKYMSLYIHSNIFYK